ISNLPTTISDSITSVSKLQPETQNDTQSLQDKLQLLEQENTHLKAEKELLSKNLDDIRQAMILIESKLPTTPEPVSPVPTKKPWQFWKK
ncbi:DNA-binding protein, partial [Providencia stuartii]|nr:DNA-binding protein [Providencia stuartii]